MIDAVRALVGTRVYTGQLPQTPTYPAVVIQRVSEQQFSHLRGGERVRRTRLQVTSIAQSRELAVSVDAAVQGAGDGSGVSYWRGSMGSPSVQVSGCFPDTVQEFYDPSELRQYRINRDYWVHHA